MKRFLSKQNDSMIHKDTTSKKKLVEICEMRRRPQDTNRIMTLINQEFRNYYNELQRNGVRRGIINNIFSSIITYVLRNERNYTGSIDEIADELLADLQKDNNVLLILLRNFGISNSRINQIFRDIIRFTLRNIREEEEEEEPITEWS